MIRKFDEKQPLKTVREVDYPNSTYYSAKKLPKMTKFERHNSFKINSRSIKNPHAHLHYSHNMYARFQSDPLKTVGEVDYTNSIP